MRNCNNRGKAAKLNNSYFILPNSELHEGLELHAALGYVFLDLLVADPKLAMALDVREFHIDLVVNHLFAPFLVDDGVDGAGEHQVCTDFHAGIFLGFFGDITLLVRKLIAEIRTFVGVGNEFSLARIDKGTFDILDESFNTDMFMALIADLANNYGRNGAFLCSKLAVPRTAEAVVDHFVGDQSGIRIIPATGEISYRINVEAGDFFATIGTAGKESKACAKG